MEITSQPQGDFIEVRAKGRLDAYWADHVSGTLEEIVRQGNHRIRVNLSEVAYISSIGIRVLVQFYKKLSAIQGVFVVSDPSPAVSKVLEMVGLQEMLMPAAAAAVPFAAPEQVSRTLEREGASFVIFDVPDARAPMACDTLGDPDLLEGCRFSEKDCASMQFPESDCAIGLGAFGSGFEECRDRFGEFLVVAGAAVYQPADGSNVPDFLLAEGSFVPELQVLYGIVCRGPFSRMARFEAKPERGVIGISELAEAALEIAGASSACVIAIAESAGLVGASLRRPPVNGASAHAPFGHPEIRKWLSFTTERAFPRSLAVVLGTVSRSSDPAWNGLLRPLHSASGVSAHFHAAAFSYRPLQKGLIDLKGTVRPLFEQETLLGLLHLISDDRESSGVAESEFVRGACWIAPLGQIGSRKEAA